MISSIFWRFKFTKATNFRAPKMKKPKKSKFRASKCVKMANFALLENQKLISRKIWVIEKLWNFHIVQKVGKKPHLVKRSHKVPLVDGFNKDVVTDGKEVILVEPNTVNEKLNHQMTIGSWYTVSNLNIQQPLTNFAYCKIIFSKISIYTKSGKIVQLEK